MRLVVGHRVTDDDGVTDPYDTGRPADVETSHVATADDLAGVIHAMVNDLRKHKDDWANTSLDAFLDALATSVEDIEQRYAARGEAVPDQPSWRLFAELLVAASGYE
jgi:hypothetical protein